MQERYRDRKKNREMESSIEGRAVQSACTLTHTNTYVSLLSKTARSALACANFHPLAKLPFHVLLIRTLPFPSMARQVPSTSAVPPDMSRMCSAPEPEVGYRKPDCGRTPLAAAFDPPRSGVSDECVGRGGPHLPQRRCLREVQMT